MYNLIIRIAIQPVIARYVRDADFMLDGRFPRYRPCEFVLDAYCRGDVPRLFADSPNLKQAGFDWKEYYNEIQEDLQVGRYL